MFIIKYLFSTINYTITIFLSILLAMTYQGAYTSPATTWWLSLLTLIAPFTVVATIVMMLYNAVKLNKIALVPLIVIILGLGKINGQFNMLFFKDYNIDTNSVKILSHNVRVFVNDEWNNVIDSTVTLVHKENPDILAFQEFYTNRQFDIEVIHDMLERYKYHSVDYIQEGNNRGTGLAIFSKYKIVDKGRKIFYGRHCGMQWADLAIEGDTVRFYNIHMKSNNITREDTKIISKTLKDINPIFDTELTDSTGMSKMTDIIGRFKSNVIERSYHSDTLAQIIETSPYNVIVCGDINDVPFSYSYSKIKGELNDSYSLKGDLYGYSYNKLHKLLKIDYIFVSDNYTVNNYDSYDVPYSDHNPLIVEVSRKE